VAIERTCEGFHARVVQHECDHLDGILYPQRMTDLTLFGFVSEMNRSRAATGPTRPDRPDATAAGRGDTP
jgi:peptide deformylase